LRRNIEKREINMNMKEEYDKNYFEKTAEDAGLLLKKRRPLWSRWTRIIRKYEASGKLLDVGCGPGFFLAYAEKHYDVHGIDISEYAVREAKQRTYHVKPSVGDTQNFCPLICVYFNIISF